MGSTLELKTTEALVLRAIIRLRDNAYGISIRDTLEERDGEEIAPSTLYRALDRLEEAGYLDARMGDPTPERGGRRKRLYKVTGAGVRALHEAAEHHAHLGLVLKGAPA